MSTATQPERQPREHAVPCLRCPMGHPTMTANADAVCSLHDQPTP